MAFIKRISTFSHYLNIFPAFYPAYLFLFQSYRTLKMFVYTEPQKIHSLNNCSR